jgi:hypothetical protein
MNIQTHVSLTSSLVAGKWLGSRPGRFSPGRKAPGTHSTGAWLWGREIFYSTETRIPTLRLPRMQSVALPTELNVTIASVIFGYRFLG